MTNTAEYDDYDAMGLAELVRSGDVRPQELLEEAIKRTEQINPKINAVVQKHYDEAEAAIRAGLPDGPFTGVPFLLKDLNILLEGTVTSMGSAMFKDYMATYNSTLTNRYIKSGLVIFGKSASPEFGALPVTETQLFGATRNPWDLDRTPGGSSGGASASVAAGIIPMANASDGGGSIRIPAACTGLVGLKPTRGRTAMGPTIGEGWGGQSISHVVSKTVRDSAAMLDATTGPEPGDPYSPPYFDGLYLNEVEKPPGKLTVALIPEKIGNGSYSPEIRKALEETASLMVELGHDVEEATPEVDGYALQFASTTLLAANLALKVTQQEEETGQPLREGDLEPSTLALIKLGRSIDGEACAKASQINHMSGRIMGRFHENYDIVLSPTLSTLPVPIGYFSDGDLGEKIGEFMANTSMFNQTGQPSISLPLAWSENKLPIGIMFSSAFGQDDQLIRLAAQLEQARPWSNRRAPHHAANLP
ncbi:MAG TPA: amidase [Gammaproteobacteria bacterium]|nr:amidase [Gammaproteobacteria bacterium]